MCYVCGKSNNKIAHTMDCRYVKMMNYKRCFKDFKPKSTIYLP